LKSNTILLKYNFMMSGAEEKNGMDAEEFQAYVVEDIEEVEAPQGHFAPIFAIAIPPAQQMHQLAVEVISKLDSMDTINRRIAAFALPEGWIRIEVALCVLGCPPGSGTLENDFSSFANLLTRHRSSMLTSTAEMILFCKQNSSLIPDLIPIISNDDIRSHIPERITDPVKQNAIREMNVNANALYVDNESDSD
jgi:hypothetical protein